MLVSEVFTRLRDLLHDSRVPYRWSDAELLRWLSDAQRAVVTLVPEANPVVESVQLEVGKYRQNLPAGGLRLLDIPRNMGANGTTPGSVIRLIGRNVLDAQDPSWTTTAGSAIEHYLYDFKTPRQFLVYPYPQSTLYVEAVFSKSPTELTATTDTFGLDDTYLNSAMDYTMFRAYAKDMDSPTSAAKAKSYFDLFQSGLGQNVTTTAQRVPASSQGGAMP